MKKMKCSQKELALRQELLCKKYAEVQRLVALFRIPARDREDAVQEIMILAFNHLHQLRDTESLDSWLYKIAYRYMLKTNQKNQLKSSKEMSFDQWAYEVEDQKTSSSQNAWKIAQYYLADEEIADLVNSLKPPAPEILRLRFVMDYTLLEISKILNMNYNTVKTIERRAFIKLKEMIEEKGGQYSEE